MYRSSWEIEDEMRRNSEIMNKFYDENPVYNGEDTWQQAEQLRRYLNRDFDDYGSQGGA